MPIILFDDKKLELTIRLRVGESFAHDDGLQVLADKANQIKNKYQDILKEVSVLLNECNKWNQDHDKEYAERAKKMMELKKKKAPQDVSTSEVATV